MKTIESLGIFWTFTTSQEKFQDEVDGLIFYGYWKNDFFKEKLASLETFKSIWGEGKIEVRSIIWEGDSNCNFSVEVRILMWPEQSWILCIEDSLKWFTKQGACIAWCGTEYSTPSLDIFELGEVSDEIYAAFTSNTGFLCNAGLYDEYSNLSKEDIFKLRESFQK